MRGVKPSRKTIPLSITKRIRGPIEEPKDPHTRWGLFYTQKPPLLEAFECYSSKQTVGFYFHSVYFNQLIIVYKRHYDNTYYTVFCQLFIGFCIIS
jgi:hypothetical protein